MSSIDQNLGQKLQDKYEIRPNPQELTGHSDPSKNSSTGVDSIKLEPARQSIVDSICNLYSGKANEKDMEVYAKESVYDDPWSYCDTRYKIAGQWYGTCINPSNPKTVNPYLQGLGIPKIFATSKTLATEIVESKPDRIIFKLRQEYTPKVLSFSKPVNSLVTLTLNDEGKVVYHKDMWNDKDYSHEGLGKIMKTLNGDHLTKITRPPADL
jgi:hypothetical protein